MPESEILFQVDENQRVLITQESPSNGSIVLVLTGEDQGEASLKAKVRSNGEVIDEIKIDVLKRYDKTLRMDAITSSSAPNLEPVNVPTSQSATQYLDKTWGIQANVHFSVYEKSYNLTYDRNGDGHLNIQREGGMRTAEELDIIRHVDTVGVDHVAAFVRSFDSDVVVGRALERSLCIITTDTAVDKVNIMAHELGHMILRMRAEIDHNNSSPSNLMHAYAENGDEIRHHEWNALSIYND